MEHMLWFVEQKKMNFLRNYKKKKTAENNSQKI